MNLPNKFEFYVKMGIIKKISPDNAKAQFLTNASENSLEGLQEVKRKIGINDKNANSLVKDAYDIIMGLVRAKLLLNGYKSSGFHSHEAEVSYLYNLKFSDNDISFLNELRGNRNSAIYYGKILDKEYGEKVVEFLEKVYPKLKKLI